MKTPDLSLDALRQVAAFLTEFGAPGFRFVHNDSPLRQTGEKQFEFVGYQYDPQVGALLDTLHRLDWVHPFPWPEWSQSPEGRSLQDDPAALAKATPEQLARLTTIFARQERFSDGAMLDFWKSGLLLGILKRASVLTEVLEGMDD